jgi:trehalose/maltose transport system permease protein
MRLPPARAGIYALGAALMAFALFPLLFALSTSLKPGAALFSPDLLPRAPTLANYATLFREQPFAWNIVNSALVAGGVVAVSLLLGLLAAWSLARTPMRGRGLLLAMILAVSMFPQVAVLSGMFELIQALGLYDRLGALLIADLTLTLPFTTWVLVTFMRQLPRELEEAALMDGVGVLTLIFRVFLPLLWPALVATGLLAFIAAWNEFLFALTFTLSSASRTVPVAIALFSGASSSEVPWGVITAASVLVTVPLVVLVVVFQRRLVAGLAAGAVKG